MGYKKNIDSMCFLLIEFFSYGMCALILGVIALIACLLFWSTIKIILVGAVVFLLVVFILTLCGVKLA